MPSDWFCHKKTEDALLNKRLFSFGNDNMSDKAIDVLLAFCVTMTRRHIPTAF
jgi:hypothetical protein